MDLYVITYTGPFVFPRNFSHLNGESRPPSQDFRIYKEDR